VTPTRFSNLVGCRLPLPLLAEVLGAVDVPVDAATALTDDVVAETVHGGHRMPVPRWAPAAAIVAELTGEPQARR
jgi:hypothetical protein